MVLPKAEIILMVDFNDLDENGCLPASMSLDVIGAVKPKPGDWVWLMDEEGPSCLGRIERVDDELIEVRPFGATMKPSLRITKGYQSEYPGRPQSKAETKAGKTITELQV